MVETTADVKAFTEADPDASPADFASAWTNAVATLADEDAPAADAIVVPAPVTAATPPADPVERIASPVIPLTEETPVAFPVA
jgi:hypothetical protein